MEMPQRGTNKKILVGELIKGREFANKLKDLLHKPVDEVDDGSVSAQQLVRNILTSFSHTLSVLSSCDDDSDDQIPPMRYVGSACSGDRTSECSGESRKRTAGKDRRGCYKRRKTSDSRIIIAPISEDEFAWRKYGQKEILNAKYPRCYFRCTHKYDQGCKALKQVQRMEDHDSNMYHITYFSHHTCRNTAKATQIFQEPLNSSYLLSFESKKPVTNTKSHPYNLNPNFAPYVKEEPKQEQSEISDNLSSADSNLWKEIIALGSSDEVPAIMGFDHDNVVSSTVRDSIISASTVASSHCLDMEFLLKSVDFDSEFPFGEME